MSLSNTKIFTAVITPMDEFGGVDFVSFERLLRRQSEAGCGILVLGSTGEALALSLDEQKEVLEFTVNLSLDVPLMVGVGGFQLNEQLKWVEYCNQFQAISAFLMVTPLYAKPGPLGQKIWFRSLLDQSKKPCMLYNVPSRTGVNLAYEVVEALSQHPNFWAIKEASGDIERFKHYVNIAKHICVYSGEDALMPELAEVGGCGLVSVVSNIWPKAAKLYVDASLSGDITNQTKILWQLAAKSCFSVANPIPVKAWLAAESYIKYSTLRAPLVADELTDLSLLREADHAVNKWYQNELEGAV
ncbi:4-hydroxy-tetrahydrodipicolinate synthase [Fangia hongkongensis]|uniref:4-hydroxy-tetrahydrodipicolinate synthase n=1 Tax=Fangia hongkongensis TaxID=270495 RepID=UPI000376ADDE|nr:4-hydroxy-tetrahydrodipicolinate synthase [Fangia hongkongensis]MBK2126377.1 4-hydroxy-tetrahydrodipicolinate synthase [Fangia hongkongensis]